MEQTQEKLDYWLVAARVAFTIALIATIAFIFNNSMQVATVSSDASGRVVEVVQEVLETVGAKSLAEQITDHLVRKIAHLAEYALVGFWLMLCLRVYTRRFVRHISWPLFAGLLIAVVDETIQLFTDGRSASITDIWIDFTGVTLGLIAAFLLLCLWRMAVILYKHRDET